MDSGLKVIPCDLEAEQALLGAMMIDPTVIPDVIAVIPREQSDRFYRPCHQGIFVTILDMHDACKNIDLVTIRDELKRRGLIEQIGGVAYITELVESVTNSAHAAQHARIVSDKATLRDLIRISHEIQEAAYASGDEPKEIIDRFEGELFSVSHRRVSGQAVLVKDEVSRFLENLERIKDGGASCGLQTGLHALDELLGGLRNGEMIVVAARPSMGKTALGLNIAEAASDLEDVPVLFFSLEMPRRMLVERLICGRAEVSMSRMNKGGLLGYEERKLSQAANEIESMKLWIDDTPSLSLFDLRAKSLSHNPCGAERHPRAGEVE